LQMLQKQSTNISVSSTTEAEGDWLDARNVDD
jgi:hypothetical protein